MMTEGQGVTTGPVVAIALGAILFGTTGVFVTWLAHYPLTVLLLFRFGCGALALSAVFIVPKWRAAFRFKRRDLGHLAALGVLFVGVDIGFFTAIHAVGVGLAAVLLYAAPLFVPFGSWLFLGERPTRGVWLGVVIGFAGVVLIVRPDVGGVAWGHVAGLFGAFAWAGWLLVSRDAGRRGVPAPAQALAANVVAAAVVVPVAVTRLPALVAPDIALAATLGVLAGALSILLFAAGLARVDASRAAVIGYLEPVTAVALGALLFGETFGTSEAAGSVLVLAGTWFATRVR